MSTDELTVSLNLSFSDYLRCQWLLAQDTWRGSALSVFFGIAMIGFGLCQITATQGAKAIWLWGVVFGSFAAFILSVFAGLRFYFNSNANYFRDVTVTADPAYLTVRRNANGVLSKHKWNEIAQVVQVADYLICVLPDSLPRNFIYVPRHGLSSESTFEQFSQHVLQNWRQAGR